MVLPVATSRLIARSFRGTLVLASLTGGLCAVVGLWLARAWNLAPGGSIVLCACACFMLSAVVAVVRGRMPRTSLIGR